ncbi:MAG: glycosyltransferase, partial [Pedobacter sp.]
MVIDVYAVIVTYNPDILLLEKQLISLENQVSGIIIIDNCSNNKTEIEQSVHSKFLTLKLILNNENRGLGYAQNFGIREAKKSGATDVILLDQDSVFNSDCVKNLIDAREDLCKQNIKVGGLGPLYYNERTKEVYPISKYYGPFIKRFV